MVFYFICAREVSSFEFETSQVQCKKIKKMFVANLLKKKKTTTTKRAL